MTVAEAIQKLIDEGFCYYVGMEYPVSKDEREQDEEDLVSIAAKMNTN